MADEQAQLEFRARLRSMVVRILGSRPRAENENKKEYINMVGTIAFANETSCYVIVKRNLIVENTKYQIFLADGSTMEIASSDFSVPKEMGCLSGFNIKRVDLNYDLNRIAAVEFGGNVGMFQPVHLCDFVNGNCWVTGGQVNHTGGNIFTHTCGPTIKTGNGAAVFDEDGHLVGICVQNTQGPTYALTRGALERELNKIFGTQDLEQFVVFAEFDGW